jgi:3-oxoacyl-[acyl-carrier-protein] synthase II
MPKRVMITGIGVVSPVGVGADAFWSSLILGTSGIAPATLFSTTQWPSHCVAEVKDADKLLPAARKWAFARSITLAVSAARLALSDAGIEICDKTGDETGVVYGATLGCLKLLAHFDQQSLREGPRLCDPMAFPDTGVSAPSCRVSIELGLRAFNTTLSNGQTSGLDAIAYAASFIRNGRASTVLAGGVEELCEETFFGHHRLGLLATPCNGTAEFCRPFDRGRNGLVLGEGSAVLVLEDYEHARSRGAKMLAEFRGYGSAFHPDGFDARGNDATRAIEQALRHATIAKSDIGAIFANANSGRAADRMESVVLAKVFQDGQPAITAIKSMVGESYSAAGAMQAAASVLSLTHRMVPPTIGYLHADPANPPVAVVTRAVPFDRPAVIVNAFGCNGNNASLVLTSPEMGD